MKIRKRCIGLGLGIALLSSLLTLAGLYFALGLNAHKISNALRFVSALRFIELQYVDQVDDTRLIDGAIAGMVKSLEDPHSLYMDKSMYKDLLSHTEGAFGGIGVFMGQKENVVTVISTMENTPGAAAGLQPGDQIVKIDGLPTSEMPFEQVALKIRGEAGTSVTLTIHRDGMADTDYEITRANIQTHSVAHTMMADQMGYIRIASFSEHTGKEFSEAYNDLEANGMKGLVLDLRGNPGGLLTSCIEVANRLVPKGDIVSIVQRDGTKEVHQSNLEAVKYPLVILIDGGSASAAEIVAGAVQDTQAGTLVGQKSYGKGSVQVVMPMHQGDALKLTIAKYYTPSGRSIDGTGIEPDVAVAMDANAAVDNQLQQAIEVLRTKLVQP